jgi:formate hydrogenlyase subunit 3/multisubunit Na+/H+ antiporter MnhD subunit
MKPLTAVSSVVLVIGLASFGVLAWGLRKAMSLDRAVDVGDLAVLSVFALFGSFCVYIAWLLWRNRSGQDSAIGARSPAGPSEKGAPRRVTLSHACATAGVVLLMLSVLVPAHWYPVPMLFVGLAFLAVGHVLTPCEERIAKLRKARASIRQL